MSSQDNFVTVEVTEEQLFVIRQAVGAQIGINEKKLRQAERKLPDAEGLLSFLDYRIEIHKEIIEEIDEQQSDAVDRERERIKKIKAQRREIARQKESEV